LALGELSFGNCYKKQKYPDILNTTPGEKSLGVIYF
jgi:hypothetical protein